MACVCDIVVAYVTLWYPCASDTHLTFWLIFLGKAGLDTQIGRLNPECNDLGHKNMDSPIRFTSIATWRNPFCCIRKSHMQSHIWNHACTFKCFPFFCRILICLPHIWNLGLRQYIAYLKQSSNGLHWIGISYHRLLYFWIFIATTCL